MIPTFMSVAMAIFSADAQLADNRIVLKNSQVKRVLEKVDDTWRTTSFSRAGDTDALVVVSDEFEITLRTDERLTVADFQAMDPEVVNRDGVTRVVLRYAPRDESCYVKGVIVTYSLGDDSYLRKTVVAEVPKDGDIYRLAVESFTTRAACDRGGRGEPIFAGQSWFLGLEYPGAENDINGGRVQLAHYPGRARASGQHRIIQSKTAVVGTGEPGDRLELAFDDYLNTIRHSNPVMLHYNSWYDFRGNELTQEAMVSTFDAFKKHVLDPYGLKMTVFVPDDGWQEPKSIWMPRDNLYPDGFGPLAKALESRDTRLGLWIPFNGYNLDVNWGAERGYEKSDRGRWYCLAGSKYNAAIREVAKRLIEQGNIGYFKHDFNQLQCTADDHGHLPNLKNGHEANLDAQLDLLAYERELMPDIYLNVTSYVWHSPWWLQHAESIWMAAGDFGYNRDWPQLSPREWAMSYRDAHFQKLYRERKILVPLSAMMTHGLIHGKYQKLGGDDETLREWSDYVVMYYGRGVQLMEWYITPSMMSKERWEVLGKATRWALDNKAVLENVVMVGGDPRLGAAYGYAHYTNDRALLVVRNPDLAEQIIEIPFDQSVRYRGEAGRPFHGRIVYPHVESLPDQFVSGKPVRLTVPGCSVAVYELIAGSATNVSLVNRPEPLEAKAQTVALAGLGSRGGSLMNVNLQIPDEDMQRCDFYLISRSSTSAPRPVAMQIGDKKIEPRAARGPDWLLQSVDLMSFRNQEIDLAVDVEGILTSNPFSRPAATVSAWVIADRAVSAPQGSAAGLPLPIGQHHRRQTIPLMEATEIPSTRNHRRLKAGELALGEHAKLRIMVFDSNDQPQYRDKSILLNGVEIAKVPANTGPLSTWQECIVDIPGDKYELLSIVNRVQITNNGGDYFKIKDLAIGVRMKGGDFIESRPDYTVHSSVARWSYAEGESFTDNKSRVIELRLD